MLFGVISLLPGWWQVIGGAYFLTNLIVKEYSGKDIGQHIDGYFN